MEYKFILFSPWLLKSPVFLGLGFTARDLGFRVWGLGV